MVAVDTKEQPAVNITEDELLECRYHPYKTRKDTLKNRQRKYLITKKDILIKNIAYILLKKSRNQNHYIMDEPVT